MTEYVIKTEHIQKSYGKKKILKDISFQGARGERIVIVGLNGCGKSTLLQILAGVMKADSGELYYDDQNPYKNRQLFRKKCGYVPQENPLMEDLTVLDNLRLWGYRKRKPDHVLLEQFGLEELLGQKVEQLSGGMKRRVSIACAAIPHPPIMLLDEPTTALDIFYRDELEQWMKLYQSRGGVIVMTTHEEAEIASADRCLVMKDGFLTELTASERDMKAVLDRI